MEEPSLTDLAGAIDAVWVLMCAYLVFSMMNGFLALEAGLVRMKNLKNIILKMFVCISTAGFTFWLVGYGIAFGKSERGFIGTTYYAMYEGDDQFVLWMFQCCFCAAALSIPSGSMAERTILEGYTAYMFVEAVLIYPFVAHWIWNAEGFLFKLGFADFAGGAVVHSVGGLCGFAGTLVLGPRLWRFSNTGEVRSIPGHNIALAAVGTVILMVGWMGFNCGSALGIVGKLETVSLVGVNTMVAMSVGFIVSLPYCRWAEGNYNLEFSMNAALAGLVSVTPCCAFIRTYIAVLLGVACVFVYAGLSHLILKFRIDDPLDASPLHFGTGAFGTLWIGLFADPLLLTAVYGDTYPLPGGLFYSGKLQLFGVQLLGMLVTISWCLVLGTVTCYGLKHMGILRVSREDELSGLDSSQVGGQEEVQVQTAAKV